MQLGYEGGPSRLIGTVLFWGILLIGVAGALGVLGLPSLGSTMDQIVKLSGRVLVALVILLAGVMSAGWLADLVARQAGRAELRGATVLRRIVFVAVIVIAALLAAAQLGLKTYVIVLLAAIVLATIGLVTALALGQGLVLLSSNIAAGRYVQDGTTVGDVISVNGIEGTVEELGYASVTIRSEMDTLPHPEPHAPGEHRPKAALGFWNWLAKNVPFGTDRRRVHDSDIDRMLQKSASGR